MTSDPSRVSASRNIGVRSVPNVAKMASTAFWFTFCLALSCRLTEAEQSVPVGRIITKNLMLSNGLDYGNWGIIEYCPDGSFAADIEALYQDPTLTDIDETALNAIKLYCQTPDGHHQGYISSTIGQEGEWKGIRACPHGLMTGMRAQVLPYQGSVFDDVAVQNIEMECNYGESVIQAHDGVKENKAGEWGLMARCNEGSAICGLEIRYESPNLLLDTTAVADLAMFCCAIENPLTTPEPPQTTTEALTTPEAPQTTPGA
ncbi:vitelline membrane outer layer protein 1-like [Palaemon carinicauda]|uniref:vitelline membrane outer layer protein 1-like n=1 Tax=Palaemon carinicauda TaxID=392227 RepID=UPI0035B5F6AF